MLEEPFLTMPDNETAMRLYWEDLLTNINKEDYIAGALALEIAPKTGRIHLQGYLEHKRKRLNTISTELRCNLTNGISVVKDAQGSWDYCSGLGIHADKPALARYTWGEPKLHGSAENTDLKGMVQAVIDGAQLEDLMKNNPYAWCVHRDRLVKFYNDWNGGINQNNF